MGFIEILLVAVGLSMDAFAVAVCKGISFKKITAKNTLTVAAYFGIFQGVMPIIGYYLGAAFANSITRYSHIISFILLVFIGGKMIYEALKDDMSCNSDSIKFGEMIMLAVATSLDAMAVGVSIALEKDKSLNIFISAAIIATVTFIFSAIAVIIGKKFGERLQRKAEVLGGSILIIIGIKILVEQFINNYGQI